MLLWIFPTVAWSVHGTVISIRDILIAVGGPLASGVAAAAFAFATRSMCNRIPSPLPRLVVESLIFLSAYLGMLLYAMGQKSQYLDLWYSLRARSSAAPSPEEGRNLAVYS
jgi:hypothetical protein